MKFIPRHRLLHISGLFLSALVWLANAGNPNNAKTGAPFDGHCNDCHSGNNPNNYGGSITVSGLSSPILPNTVYPLTVTMTTTGAGVPVRGGFQMVVVDGNNANCGDLQVIAGQGTGTEIVVATGREYIEHRNPKNFSGAGSSITWDLNWKSPASAFGNTAKLYFIGNFCNGSGSGGDFLFNTNDTYTFQAPPAIEAAISNTTNVLCFGQANGNATVTASGGNGVYTYLWSNNQTTQTLNNVAAGNYTVTVTDNGGGTATAVAAITQPLAALAGTTQVSNVITCLNPSATITATGTGGTAPYNYAWANGNQGNTNQVFASGTYIVTITDTNGCTKTASAAVSQNTTVPAAIATGNVQSCATNTATVSGQGSSTGASFAYSWTAPSGGNIISGASSTSAVVSGLGNYVLVVTNIVNGCTASATAIVTGSTPPGATATGATISCISPGGIIMASSPTPNVSYAWSGPNNFMAALQNPSVTAAGVYTVTVTATGSGCTATATATVSGDLTPPNLAVAVTPATCAVPTCTATASSTSAGVTYSWTGVPFSPTSPTVTLPPGGPYNVIATGSNGCTSSSQVVYAANTTPPTVSITGGALSCSVFQTSVTATSNASNSIYSWSGPGIISGNQTATIVVGQPGPYAVTVTNPVNGCTATATFLVTANIIPPTVSIAPPAHLNCINPAVTINAAASSQGAELFYAWNGPGVVSGSTTLMPVVNVAGVYTVTISNIMNGCTTTGSVTVIQNSEVITSIGNVILPACFGSATGSATALPTGGVGGFSFLWSNGATTAQASGLIAGTYTVTATDTEGCSSSGAIAIAQPAALLLTVTSTPETGGGLNNGTATANPTGGTAPYIYLWSNGGTTPTIESLAPGAYTATVTDANGCTAVQTVTVNSFNCVFTATLTATNVTCVSAGNGTATVVLVSAALPVVYQWSNLGFTSTVNNLVPGVYTVTVTDASNCSVIVSTTIGEPAPLFANATATAVSAVGVNDGTATANPSGGVGPYTYLWSNLATTQTIVGLSVGNYMVTVTDNNGCTTVQSTFVSAFNCSATALVNATNVTCAGASNGTASALMIGGTAPLTYLWNTGAVTASIAGLSPGTYTVTVVDANGCAASAETTITQPAPLLAEVTTVHNVSCLNEKTGFVDISVTGGGAAPYNFTYPGSGQSLLGVGLYTITVTNASGCTTLLDFSIVAIDTIPPTVTCPSNIEKCDDGTVTGYSLPTATDNCFVGSLQYTLLEGVPSGSPLSAGVYNQVFRVTDLAGNSSTCSFSITIFAPPDIALVSITYDTSGMGTGSINISPLGGTLPYTYEWKKDGVFFSSDEDLTGLFAGSYKLKATDANGCEVSVAPFNILNIVGTIIPFRESGISISPNPANNWITLDFKAVTPVALEVYDAYGRLVLQLSDQSTFNHIDLTVLASGVYHILVDDDRGQRHVARLVKAGW